MMPGISGPGRLGSGVFFGGLIIVLGVVFLGNNLGVINLGGSIFQWWPVILIAVGAWLLISSGFRRMVAPLVLIVIGAIFLLGNLGLAIDLLDYWPVLLIIIGVVILSRAISSPR